MALIVTPKTKQQKKIVKAFLESLSIGYAEETVLNSVKKRGKSKSLLVKKEEVLENLNHSVDFVKNYKKGKVKAKSFNQLLNEV